MIEVLGAVLIKNSLITAFAFVGLIVWASYWVSGKLTAGHIHGSAIAIAVGLLLAYLGGVYTGGSKGLADIGIFGGMAIMEERCCATLLLLLLLSEPNSMLLSKPALSLVLQC